MRHAEKPGHRVPRKDWPTYDEGEHYSRAANSDSGRKPNAKPPSRASKLVQTPPPDSKGAVQQRQG